MQKYQYFEWGSNFNLDGFKMIIFQYIICEHKTFKVRGTSVANGVASECGARGKMLKWRPRARSASNHGWGPGGGASEALGF